MFQEGVLAERAMFLSGLDTVDVDEVIKFTMDSLQSVYGYLPLTSGGVSETITAIEAGQRNRAQGQFEDRLQSSESPTALITNRIPAENMSYLIYTLCSRSAQDPVDRVWAIAGLLSKDVQAKISPSIGYSDESRAQYWRTYIEFAKVVFTEYQSPVLLDMPRAVNGRYFGQPLWRPDLSGQPKCVLLLGG